LLLALDRFDAEPVAADRDRLAVDLGCGEGRDTVELLRRGWRVLAVDNEPDAIARLGKRVAAEDHERLEMLVSSFEDATWPAAALVNSSFALPFCAPELFADVWDRIVASLHAGGRFSGQLFGERDEWAGDPTLSVHGRSEVEDLLAPFAIERFDEVEEDGQTALGAPKHWHVFHIVARKG
jgi:tellurite methyltransferase